MFTAETPRRGENGVKVKTGERGTHGGARFPGARLLTRAAQNQVRAFTAT